MNSIYGFDVLIPNIQRVANDLHTKGLLEAGKYIIDIDW